MSRVCFVAILAMTATPAFAGVAVVPTPEAGAGLASLAVLGAAYTFMRRRKNQD